jgi:hypothetical protein
MNVADDSASVSHGGPAGKRRPRAEDSDCGRIAVLTGLAPPRRKTLSILLLRVLRARLRHLGVLRRVQRRQRRQT